MRRRFFVEEFAGQRAVITGEAAHHLGRVLRAQQGQLYELSDGRRVWLGRVERVTRDQLEFALIDEIPAYQPSIETTLLLSIIKFDAFEWAIEKATELGVSRIVPLAAARSEKALIGAAAKRAERWKKILAEASQQARRVSVPMLETAARPEQAFAGVTQGAKIVLSERTAAENLREILGETSGPKIAIALGPEGGWTEQEFQQAHQAGFREASLGKLILRTETAVIAALASLNYALAN